MPRVLEVSQGGGHFLMSEVPLYPEVGLSILRQAYLSRGGPVCFEAGLFRGRSIYPKAGLHKGVPGP